MPDVNKIIPFPSRGCSKPLEASPCPLCDVMPEVRVYSEGGYHATCICPSCGAGSLPSGSFYGETENDAALRALARWDDLVCCAYDEDIA